MHHVVIGANPKVVWRQNIGQSSGKRNRNLAEPIVANGRVYTVNAKGEVFFSDIPNKITDLKDDPYRSLSGALRRSGGYAKDTTPFAEFTWADFLRRRIKAKLVETDFDAALAKSLKLAQCDLARHLPGWSGPCS